MEKYYPKTLEELTSEDYEGLLEFKNCYSLIIADFPEMDTLWHAFRFYRAKKFDIYESEAMARKFAEYRKELDMGRIMDRDHSDYLGLESYVESGRYGTDKYGRPIIIERMAYTDHKEIMKAKYDALRIDYFIQRYERLLFIEFPMASAAVGRRIDKTIIINDLDGVSFSKMFDTRFKEFLKLMVIIGQNNYPELAEHTFLVNVPKMFKGMWNMLQSWFNKKNSSSVTLHSSVPYEKLKGYMDVTSLPVFLGGENTIPLKENHGPWKEAIEESKLRRSFFLKDRTFEYKYFYTKEEQQDVGSGVSKLKRLNTKSHNKPEDNSSKDVRHFPHKLHLHQK